MILFHKPIIYVKLELAASVFFERSLTGHDPSSPGTINELIKTGRVPGGRIFLSREQTEQSRTIPSFRKKRTLRTRS